MSFYGFVLRMEYGWDIGVGGKGVRMFVTAGRIDDRKMVDRKIADSGRGNSHFSGIKSWRNDVWARVPENVVVWGSHRYTMVTSGARLVVSGPLSVLSSRHGQPQRIAVSDHMYTIYRLAGQEEFLSHRKKRFGKFPRCCESWSPRYLGCGAAAD